MAQYVPVTVAACLPAKAVSIQRKQVISLDKISKIYLFCYHITENIFRYQPFA